ncbi:MAG: nucleotide sugar dehydrogenase [Phycisphaerales bacterium]
MTGHRASLLERITSRHALVGVVGLGYVGLPLVRAFHNAGFPTLGFDIDPQKILALNAGRDYLKHPEPGLARKLLDSGRFGATGDFARLAEPDAILVCVPTPLAESREPDLSYVEQTVERIARTLRPGQLVVLESTTYPGTTRDVVLPRLARSGLNVGDDFFLAYSPEREDPGSPGRTAQHIPKLVGSLDEASSEVATTLYAAAVERVVRVRTPEVAEAAKLLENVYRSVNIALVNEMKVVLETLGIDAWEVIDAAATKPFGFQRFDPGPGMGGHCIPIDPFYLSWKARQVGADARFIELAGEVNHAMPARVVAKTIDSLRARKVDPAKARVLVLGLAYKKNIDDVRESPSFEIISLLREHVAHIDYADPHVPSTHPGRRGDLGMTAVELAPGSLASYDAVVVATDHDAFDWPTIGEHARLIIDARGRMRTLSNVKAPVVPA